MEGNVGPLFYGLKLEKARKARLIGPELVQETTDKVVLIKEKLNSGDRDHSKRDMLVNSATTRVLSWDSSVTKMSPWKGCVERLYAYSVVIVILFGSMSLLLIVGFGTMGSDGRLPSVEYVVSVHYGSWWSLVAYIGVAAILKPEYVKIKVIILRKVKSEVRRLA
ncbi:hypothetical protein Tco_0330839 [Tanacetum coccineum]